VASASTTHVQDINGVQTVAYNTNVLHLTVQMFADVTAVANALEAGGVDALTFNGNWATPNHNALAIDWLDNSNNVHYGIVDINGTLTDHQATAANLTVVDVVQLVGVDTAPSADFHFAGVPIV